MIRGKKRPQRAALPDTAVLYSVDDIARMARVGKATVIRLCLSGRMPEWLEVDGRKYWDRDGADEAIARVCDAPATQDAA